VAEGVQHKLMLKLLEFDFSIEYKKGKENLLADALSRKCCKLFSIFVAKPMWIKEVLASYVDDTTIKSLLEEFLITPPPPESN
jgi:hypothetical protein